MVELFVIINNKSGISYVIEEYKVDIFVQDLVKGEMKEKSYHYSGEEYLEGSFNYLMELAPYYIKAIGTALETFELKEVFKIIHNHYKENIYDVTKINVNCNDIDFTKNVIEEIGIDSYLRIKNKKDENYVESKIKR